jgi:hypothetical protein
MLRTRRWQCLRSNSANLASAALCCSSLTAYRPSNCRSSPPITKTKDDAGGTGGQLEADAIVFDERPQKSSDAPQVEVVTGGELSDAQLQALWPRRVQTMPADFLRAKFAYQLSRRQQEKPQP